MSMQANKRESHWISVPITQGGTETDWIEQQPIIEGSLGSVTKRTGTSATQLVCLDEDISDGQRFVVRQDAAVYEGTANVTSFQDVEVDRIYGASSMSYDNMSYEWTGIGRPYNIALTPDGTKMFLLFVTTNRVHQFTLATPYDISTPTSVAIFSIDAQETNPRGIFFSPNGTKMFITGNSLSVHQYTLTTGFDLTTASYDSVSYSVSSETTSADDIAFNPDGTKMFISGINSLYQYTLTTGFDLTTASYDSVSYTAPVTANISTIAFSSDGTRMFSTQNRMFYAYSLTTGFDLTTASYDGASFDLNGDGQPGQQDHRGLVFAEEINKVFTTVFDYVFRYTIPDDIVFYKQENTINLTDFGLAASPQYVFTQVPDMRVCLEDTGPRCISRDTPMYLHGVGTDQIQVVYSDTLDQVLEADDLVVVNDGDVGVTSVVDTGTTTTPLEIDSQQKYTLPTSTGVQTYDFGDNGNLLFIVYTSKIETYTLSSPWDITSPTLLRSTSFSQGFTNTIFSNDGTRLYFINDNDSGSSVAQYRLDPWNTDTMFFDVTELFSMRVSSGMFNRTGDKLYLFFGGSSGTDEANQFTLSTPWDITTAVLESTDSEPQLSGGYVFDDGLGMITVDSNVSFRFALKKYQFNSQWNISNMTITDEIDLISLMSGDWAVQYAKLVMTDDKSAFFTFFQNSIGDYYIQKFGFKVPLSLKTHKIWNVNLPLTITPTYAFIKDRSELMPYTLTPVAGTVNQYNVSLSTAGSLNHTFDSQSFEIDPKRAIQLSAIAGNDTTVTTLRANLWKAGTPTL